MWKTRSQKGTSPGHSDSIFCFWTRSDTGELHLAHRNSHHKQEACLCLSCGATSPALPCKSCRSMSKGTSARPCKRQATHIAHIICSHGTCMTPSCVEHTLQLGPVRTQCGCRSALQTKTRRMFPGCCVLGGMSSSISSATLRAWGVVVILRRSGKKSYTITTLCHNACAGASGKGREGQNGRQRNQHTRPV